LYVQVKLRNLGFLMLVMISMKLRMRIVLINTAVVIWLWMMEILEMNWVNKTVTDKIWMGIISNNKKDLKRVK